MVGEEEGLAEGEALGEAEGVADGFAVDPFLKPVTIRTSSF